MKSTAKPKGRPAPAGHTRLTINIRRELAESLRFAAFKHGCTVTDFVLRSLAAAGVR